MKILIWIVCIFGVNAIIVALKTLGISFGAIPSFLIYAFMFWLISFLCKKWDKHKRQKQKVSQKGDENKFTNNH